MTTPALETTQVTSFDYALWTEILNAMVTPEGKVDYEILARHRALLAAFVAQLGAASPDTTEALFPTPEHVLAYWINAYNAFVLAAVIEEYPIRSVWKVRDGQFFTRERHLAGGILLSLNDIEHRILRGRFREPRIHFALNCASNGCPPMRPQAFVPEDIRQTLGAATRQFLASEWNCRIDHRLKKIFVSRLFRMYAEDFAGEADSTAEYRLGVLRFVAEHTGEPLESIAAYGVVYNTYDWGLNDAHRDPQLPPIRFHESVETFHAKDGVLRELYLYDGNFCNRACPLAIENPAPHFRLGDLTTPPSVLFERYRQFRTWATTVLDPAARQRQITSCAMCQQHLGEIPTYDSV